MIVVDIAADLNDEDDTGLVWTFLDEARNPAIVVPGAIVVAGNADAPAVAEVVDLGNKPAGTIVHLRLLPRNLRLRSTDTAQYIARLKVAPHCAGSRRPPQPPARGPSPIGRR